MDLKEYRDERGTLLPIDFGDLPFVPRRLFYISNVPNGTVRGGHAHKKCKQIFVCLAGEIFIHLWDGTNRKKNKIHANQTVEIPAMVWSIQEFYKNSIALVLASEKYNEKDYIRNYEVFLEMLK